MEQAPDELSGQEGEQSEEEIDKLTDEPMNSPDKQKQAADGDHGPSVADANRMGG